METSQFEGKKIALKQTKDGYAMTLAIHPDDIPDELMRDFVGARYMVVMVRLADNEEPLNREEFAGNQMVKMDSDTLRVILSNTQPDGDKKVELMISEKSSTTQKS